MAVSLPAGLFLPPSEIDCKWWKQGYCARGKTCYFRHDDAMAGVDNKKPDPAKAGPGSGKANAKFPPQVDRDGSPSDTSSPTPAQVQICTICLETPDTFGLLVNCDHVFCLECIRDWRSSTNAPLPSNEELKDTSKTCPLCRAHSDFIIPSSHFPVTSSADMKDAEITVKKEIIDRYLSRLKNIPCRYFEKSIEDSLNSTQKLRPRCKFGNGCHYAHNDPITKQPYIFSEEEFNRGRRRQRQRRPRYLEEDMAMVEADFTRFIGGLLESDDDFGCDDEDLAFFESGSDGFGFGADSDFDDFDPNWE